MTARLMVAYNLGEGAHACDPSGPLSRRAGWRLAVCGRRVKNVTLEAWSPAVAGACVECVEAARQ